MFHRNKQDSHACTQVTVAFWGLFAQASELGWAPTVSWGSLAQV